MSLAGLLNMKLDIGAVVKTLSERLPGQLLTTHLKTLFNPERISVAGPDWDGVQRLDSARQVEIFTGRLLLMYRLAWEVLTVNYKDFLSLMPAPSGKKTTGQKKTGKSPGR